MSEESLMPERDALWAKHDGLTPALAAEMLAFAGKMEMERNVWKHEAGVAAAELKSEQEKALGWFLEFHALKQAVAETLEKDCHLADGDVCTLKKLKDAYAKANSAGHGLDSENAQALAPPETARKNQKPNTETEAAETVQTTETPAVDHERLVRLRGTPNQLADLWEKSAREFSDEVGDDVSLRGTTNRAYAQCLKTCAEQIRDYCGEISAAAKSCEWCEHGKSLAIQSGSPVACMIHEKLFSASHTCDRWEILQTNSELSRPKVG